MKTLKHLLVLFTLLFVISFGTTAQTTYQNWTALPESPTNFEVSWQTAQCAPLLPNEIRLFIFNEESNSQNANFTLTISEVGKTSVDHVISNLTIGAAQMYQADCGSTVLPELIFNVPAGFDPSALTISITYN